MRTAELVSVVIPAYNQGQFVRDAVSSVLAQTYRPLEVFVIDDGSSDGTRDRLASLSDQITYIYQQNRGLSAARNAGIQRARGEWIALLDADDLWHRQKLEVQLAAVHGRKDVALIGSPTSMSLPVELPSAPRTRCLTVRDFLLSVPMGPSSAVLRRRSMDAIGLFDEALSPVADRDMWLRIAVKSPCILVESPCWWYRQHPAQMSRNAARMFDSYRCVLAKFFAANPGYRNFYRLAMSYLYFDAAWPYLCEGKRLTALLHLARSAVYRPLGLGDPRRPPFTRSKLAGRVVLDQLRQLTVQLRGSD